MFQPIIFCILLTFSLIVSAAPGRLIANHQKLIRDTERTETDSTSESKDISTYFHTQTLDHFNYNPQSFATFNQRYVINSKYWGGANSSAPIFANLGEEAPLSASNGFISDNAPGFKALMVNIKGFGEHIKECDFHYHKKWIPLLGYTFRRGKVIQYGWSCNERERLKSS